MDEVLRWFNRNRIEFVSSIPSIGDVDFKDDEPIFQKHSAGSRLDRLSTELEMLLSGGPDGGLFIMIGQKAQIALPAETTMGIVRDLARFAVRRRNSGSFR